MSILYYRIRECRQSMEIIRTETYDSDKCCLLWHQMAGLSTVFFLFLLLIISKHTGTEIIFINCLDLILWTRYNNMLTSSKISIISDFFALFLAKCWKMAKHTLKILQFEHRKIFKVYLVIFQLCTLMNELKVRLITLKLTDYFP